MSTGRDSGCAGELAGVSRDRESFVGQLHPRAGESQMGRATSPKIVLNPFENLEIWWGVEIPHFR
jgi:hypothetical protein